MLGSLGTAIYRGNMGRAVLAELPAGAASVCAALAAATAVAAVVLLPRVRTGGEPARPVEDGELSLAA